MVNERVGDGTLAVLDLGLLEEAFGEIDEDAIATLRLFVTSTRPLLEDVQLALLDGNPSRAAEAAHSAKGACNVTGAFRLGALCAGICDLLRAGEVAEARKLAEALPTTFAEVEAQINAMPG
jgi:HPt (histidine-containing phosphotransfer) domain-containing protein